MDSNWTDALRRFIEQADALGVLLWSWIVAATTGGGSIPKVSRFRAGDDWAPLVFVNGADSKARRCLRLLMNRSPMAGRIGRLLIAQALMIPIGQWNDVQPGCGGVAGSARVASKYLQSPQRTGRRTARLARRFNEHTGILRRIHDAGGLSRDGLLAVRASVRLLRSLPSSVATQAPGIVDCAVV